MLTDASGIFLNVVAGVAIGAITAAVSVRLALHRFRAERRWERKVSAYTDIFDALYHVQKNAKMHLNQIENGVQYDKEYAMEVSRRASEGYDAIRSAAIKGTFLLGSIAARRLEEIVSSLDRPRGDESLYDEIDADLGIVSAAIVELRQIAIEDVQRG